MKTVIPFLILGFSLLLQACHPPGDESNGRPAIRSVSFVGIPDQNVRFDAANARITVQLPAVLSGGLQPVFKLTDEARVVDGLLADHTLDLTPFCSCNPFSNQPTEITLKVGDQTTTATYKLRVIPSGTLKAVSSNSPSTFSRQTKRLEMRLPVENLYTNPRFSMLVFTNVSTGEKIRISADAACLNSCQSTAPNQLIFDLRTPIETRLMPGTYTLTADGMDFSQPLIVTD
ncbi:hypothetical protein GCM10027347_39980 [Larkinella harenae]